jgi:hypothetical protein
MRILLIKTATIPKARKYRPQGQANVHCTTVQQYSTASIYIQ